MACIITVIVCGFIAFCASDFGANFFEKLNQKNWEREMAKIDPNFPTEMKQQERLRKSQIEKLKTDLLVNIAYGQYLESLKGKRRAQKVLTIEEFVEANFEQFKPMVCTVNLNDAGEIESVNIGDGKNIPIETVRKLSPEIYSEIMKEYRRHKLS